MFLSAVNSVSMPQLSSITRFLNEYFQTDLYTEKTNGLIVPASKDIARLGLALEPWENITAWIEDQQLDAVILHRFWQLNIGTLPPGVGILAYHLPFDEKLALGYNPLLAQQLGMTALDVFGNKEGHPLGMMGSVKEIPVLLFQQRTEEIFGGLEEVKKGKAMLITKVTVVGAMTDQLIREAAINGVQLYITGQLRNPAIQAVQDTGMHILAVGYHRSEQWGLHALASVLTQQWHSLEISVAVF